VEPDPTVVAALAAARAAVLERIAAACARAGRDPASVTLVAVSKTVEADRLRAAVAAGLATLGENRVQEAAAKVPLVPNATWHLVGHLQGNKARLALSCFATIESVDSTDLARRLDRLVAEGIPHPAGPERLPILIQVNVDADPAKAGFPPDALAAELPALLALPNLEVRGLMTVGRLTHTPDDARTTFAGLRALSATARASAPGLGPDLSMGMSDDFEVAIEEGSTIVRVGRALFGDRPHAAHEHGIDHHH